MFFVYNAKIRQFCIFAKKVMTVKEFKKLLSDEIIKYPHLYKEETWVFDILTADVNLNERECGSEWMPTGGTDEDGTSVTKLINYWVL